MIYSGDTIAAVATADGDGGIAVIRISGDAAHDIARKAFRRKRKGALRYSYLYYGDVTDDNGDVIDEAMCVLMKAPHTYTCENVAEIQCHGGRMVTSRVLGRILALGARPAGPGEFTRRAFLNGRIDLSEAEAVMQLISADSEAAARASVRQLEGGVSGMIRHMRERLITLRSSLEAAIDYPEEVDETETAAEVMSELKKIRAELKTAGDENASRMVRDGVSCVISGRPNAGKSSLLNALTAQELAIVTDVPGTTRDVLTCRMRLNGINIDISDTAGIRDTSDVIEHIGVERAEAAERAADIVLSVIDASAGQYTSAAEEVFPADKRRIVLLNKWDACDEDMRAAWCEALPDALHISAVNLEGLDALRAAISEKCAAAAPAEQGMTVKRHIDAAERCARVLERAEASITSGMPADVIADDITSALSILGEITGEDLNESVIDEIFKNFCVGK